MLKYHLTNYKVMLRRGIYWSNSQQPSFSMHGFLDKRKTFDVNICVTVYRTEQ